VVSAARSHHTTSATSQVVGAILAVGLLAVLYPDVGRVADEIVVPHETTREPPSSLPRPAMPSGRRVAGT
jgi:hypothetical protein